MSSAAVRVQTRYPSAEALLHVVGASLTCGSLRLPIHIAFEHAFELTLASLDGEDAVGGTAEVIERAGDATWVRFLSAAPESTGENTRCVLVDTEVMSPVSLASKADAFEVVTSVNEPVALPPPPPAPTPEPEDDLRIPTEAEVRETVEAPPLVAALIALTASTDAVATERGIAPIAAPYVTTRARRSIRLVMAAASAGVVSASIAAASFMWARGAASPAKRPKPVIAVAPPAAPLRPATCNLDISASVAESTVVIDGDDRGFAPTTMTVACGKPVTVEVRHARYAAFKQTVTPAGHDELVAALVRENAELTVSSKPLGATVTYNGTSIGKTPVTVKVPRYEQGTLAFSMPGMKPDSRRILPKTRKKTVTIQLAKQ